MKARGVRLGSMLFAMMLFAAACGSDDGGGDGGDTGSTGVTGATGEPAVPLEDQSIVFGNFGAYTPDGLLEDFTAATGAEVTISEFSTNEDMIGKISAAGGTGYDVVMVTGNHMQTLVDAGYVAELDHAQIPNIANLYPEVTELAYDPGNVTRSRTRGAPPGSATAPTWSTRRPIAGTTCSTRRPISRAR